MDRVICIKTLSVATFEIGITLSVATFEIGISFITKDKIYDLKFDIRFEDGTICYKIYELDGKYVGIFVLDREEYFVNLSEYRDKRIEDIFDVE